jgi:hypothetical protein
MDDELSLEELLGAAKTVDDMENALDVAHAEGRGDYAWHILAEWVDDSAGSSTEGAQWIGVLWLDDGALILYEDSQGFHSHRTTRNKDEAQAELNAADGEGDECNS